MENAASPTENPQSYLEEIASLKATVAKQAVLIQFYEAQLLQAKRRQFGSSSEKSDADSRQLNLFGEAEASAPETELAEVHYLEEVLDPEGIREKTQGQAGGRPVRPAC